MSPQKYLIDEQTIWVFNAPNVPATGVFYTFPNDEHEATKLAQMLPENVAWVAIFNRHWERDFTPWAAERVFKKGADFAGGAAAYQARLCGEIIPQIERESGIQAAWRGVLAYSLAGLWAVYGAIVSPYFERVASVSGSLWFDGFVDFVQTNRPAILPQASYFSLGNAEAQTKNPRMAQVQIATEQIVAQWQAWGGNSIFVMNEGGHFDDVPQRLAKAAHWLIQAA